MYDKSDKKRLYWLIDEYLSHRISEPVFCDEFYLSYGLGVDPNILSEKEKKSFLELYEVSSRFSEFEDDHKLDPRAFSTVIELREKILEVKKNLYAKN